MKKMKRFLLALAVVCVPVGGSAFAQNSAAAGPTTTGGGKQAPAAPASPSATVLYSQLDNDTGAPYISQDFEPMFDLYDTEGADDFVVPPDVSWVITSVTIVGQYFNGSGPAAAVNLTIFQDATGTPGAAACSYPLQTPADTAGTFVFTLTSPCILASGNYWLVAQARMDFAAGGEWGWDARSVQGNAPALWENPIDGFATGCTTFMPMQPCLSAAGPDFVFSLSGQAVAVTPKALLVDTTGAGNLNGVLEIGETATIAPSWTNDAADVVTLQGLVTDFSGPVGPSYVVDDGTADYGAIAGGATANCSTATGDCFAIHITGTRPAQHFDASLTEQLTPSFSAAPSAGLPPQVWTLHVGESFTDTPTTDQFYKFVETIFHNGVTGGCGGTDFCPTGTTLRKQMAVFLLKAKLGSSYVPPACTGTVFNDVPCTGGPFDPWIEDLAAHDVTNGCGNGNYCPESPVTRAQMAVFLLRMDLGGPYFPPPCTGTVFLDVPCTGGAFDPWIEDLAARGITGGCGGGDYCPGNTTTRGQMAVFLTKTFGLVLYGP